MNTAERRAVAALWTIRGVGSKTLALVKARFPELGDLLERPTREWVDEIEWKADAGSHLREVGTLAARADWLERRAAETQVQVIFSGDTAWPSKLAGIPDEPAVLFLKGKGGAAPARRRLAIVGSRTPDGLSGKRVRDISAEAAKFGLGVVSGAAIGVDSLAHFGALDARGETWAFMGAALDELDDAQVRVAKPILNGGGSIFSEFPPGYRANLNSFTRRNRLISGASDAVLLFRARRGSGSLHTAEYAREQKRPVLVTPSDPWNAMGQGGLDLVREGQASLHLDLSDLLEAVGLKGKAPPPPEKVFDLSAQGEPVQQVFRVIARGPTDFESLLAELPDLETGQVASALCRLEVIGAILHVGGRRYEKH